MKKGYKQTDVGVIPEEWEVREFGQIASLERGKFTARPRNDPKYFGGDIPFIQTGDVRNSNGFIRTYSQTLNAEGLKVSRLFPSGTLFFTIAANIGDVGFAAFDTACPDSLIAITTGERVYKHWLYQELSSRKKAFEGLATQNAQLNINLEKLRPCLLLLPPLAEQRAIASALGDMDALITSLEELIGKKRDIKQATMQQLLTGKQRLPGFGTKSDNKQTNLRSTPEDWTLQPLLNTVRIATGQVDPRVEPYASMVLVAPDHIESGTGRLLEIKTAAEQGAISGKYLFNPGDVIYSKIRPYLQKAFVANFRGLCSADMYPLTPTDSVAEFILATLLGKQFTEFATAVSARSGIPKINREELAEYILAVPPIAEQIAIATVLSDMDAEIVALEKRLEKTRALKQGMMQELLTGRTRLG